MTSKGEGPSAETPSANVRGRLAWEITWRTVLVLNLLDLTTSIPSAYNTLVGPSRGLLAWIVQGVLGVIGLVWITRSLPDWLAALNKLPLPAGAKIACALLLGLHLVQLFFYLEYYPLTNVGMFTYEMPPWSDTLVLHDRYMVNRDGKPTIFSIRRTGDPFFSSVFETDARMCLILSKWRSHPGTQKYIRERFLEAGERPPMLAESVKIRFHADRVEIVGFKPWGLP